ncbi:MAG: AraC family transcriptional regulator [Clostridiales bacterium]|nr:AraC family transcriptional regulator [Clostridiales bacterium]
MINNGKSNILYKYLLSYLLMFIIPLIIMGSMMYKNTVIDLKREVEVSSINKLEQINSLISMRMCELQNMAAKISYDPDLMSFMVKNGGYNTKKAIEELSKYKDNSSFIDEIFLYFRGDNIIYSSLGSNSLDTLIQYVYKYNAWDKQQFINDINNISFPSIRPAEDVNINKNENLKLLTYLYPIPPKSGYPYGTVIFIIRESMIDRMISNVLGNFQGSVYIVDENNNILASKNSGTSIEPKDLFLQMNKHNATGIYEASLNKKKYSFINVKSETTKWRFIVVMPTSQFLVRIVHMRMLILQIMLLSLIMGIGIAYTLSIKNYRPIKNLSEYIKERWSKTIAFNGNNELDTIRNAMDDAISHNEYLIAEMDTQRPMVKQQFLSKLLKGDISNSEELTHLLSSSQLIFKGQYFSVMLISLKPYKTLSVSEKEKIIQFLSHIESQYISGYGIELIQGNAIALVLNMDNYNGSRYAHILLARHLILVLGENFNITTSIGIGRTYHDIMCVNRSFIEASAALEYRTVDKAVSFSFFDEVVASAYNCQLQWYPAEEQLRLAQSIKQGDRTVAIDTLKTIMSCVIEKKMPIRMLKFICFDIINIIVKALREMKIEKFTINIEDYLEFQSIESLYIKLSGLIGSICDYIEENRESKNIILRDNILLYINNSFKNYGLSLENIAGHFNLSISYLSRFFKEQTGNTFTEYIKKLRIDEVKRQLVSTNRPIKDIVQDVGYFDIPSFVRKFKSIEGITPGEYRKLNLKRII